MGSTPLPRELTEPDPEKVLVKEALSEAHRGIMTGEQATEEEARRLWTVLKERMLAELSVTEKRRA